MANELNSSHFSFIYRADCITCGEYVGPKRKDDKAKADEDAAKHKAIPGNENHIVKIEVTQKYHLF